MTTNRTSHSRLTWCARIAAAIAPVTAAAALAHAGLAVDTRYSPDTGHTYKVVTNPLPADAASAEAVSEDGYLATITSPAEQSFVQNLLRRAQVPGGTYWVGPNADGSSAAVASNAILWGGPNHPIAAGNGSQSVVPGSGAGTKLRGYVIEFGASGGGGANAGTGGGVTGGSTNSPGTSNGGGTSGSLAGGNVPGTTGSGTGTGTTTGGTTTGGTTTGGTTTGGTTTGGTGSGTAGGTGTGGTGNGTTGGTSTGGTGSTGTGTTGTGAGGNGSGTSGSGSTGNGTGGTGTGTGSTGGFMPGGSGSGLGGGSSGGGPAAVPLPAALYLFPAGMALAGIAQRRMKRRR